jgi:hypothetical protein
MQFIPQRDPVQPSRDSDIPSHLVRAMLWVTALIIEGFASCAVGLHPELMWLADEHGDHNDRTNAPSSAATYRPSPPEVASRKRVARMPTGSPNAVLTAGRDRHD